MVRRVTIAALSSVVLTVLGVWFLLALAPKHSTMIEVVAGAVVSIIVTLWFGRIQRPDLSLQVYRPGNPDRLRWRGWEGKVGPLLQVDLVNNPLPCWVSRLIGRDTASHCRGRITFRHADGSRVDDKPMTVRWSDFTQPVVTGEDLQDGSMLARIIYELERLATGRAVPPGLREKLDVAARFEGETDAVGWSNATGMYSSQNSVPWKLSQGTYLAEIEINGANAYYWDVFRLENEGPLPDGFCLAPASKREIRQVKKARRKEEDATQS